MQPISTYNKNQRPFVKKQGFGNNQNCEDEEDDDDPLWVDFDPKKEDKFNFAGRSIPNEG